MEIQDSFAEEVFDITEGSATIAVGKLAACVRRAANRVVRWGRSSSRGPPQ